MMLITASNIHASTSDVFIDFIPVFVVSSWFQVKQVILNCSVHMIILYSYKTKNTTASVFGLPY